MAKPRTRKQRRIRRRTLRRVRKTKKGGADKFPLLPNDAAIRVSNPENADNVVGYHMNPKI